MAVVSLDLLKALKKAGVDEKLAEKAALEVAESVRLVSKQDKKIDILSNKVNILVSLNIAMFATLIASFCGIILLFVK